MVLWLAIIMLESTGWLSSKHTGGFLLSLITSIFGPVNPAAFDVFHGILRKTGHFVGYGTLSLLFFRALRASVTQHLRSLCLLSVLFTCLVASLDEWHQTYIPSRSGSLADVALDTFAAVCVQLVVLAIISRRRNQPRISEDVIIREPLADTVGEPIIQ